MDDLVLDTFWKIGERPSDYLPEKSIWTLKDFLHAYSSRVAMMQIPSRLDSLYGEFHPWLTRYFSIASSTQSVYSIVDSFSSGTEESFESFFSLFRDFYAEASVRAIEPQRSGPFPNRCDVLELIRSIRRRPELFLGYPHLSGLNAYLCGYERAGADLGLPKTPADIFFDEFRKWIVEDKFPGGRPRSWYKLILFWSLHDCGATSSSAYTFFFVLLDEYATKSGRPGAFEIDQSQI